MKEANATADGKEAECVTDWLSDQTIGHAGIAWKCWSDDPFPDLAKSRQNRYYHYRAIAQKLGMTGFDNRAQLPCCVMKNIAERYPDAAPKVGFKRSKFDF